MLEVRDVDVSYHGRHGRNHVLRNVSVTVGAGEAVAVIGESGSGKTTLARTVLGVVAPQSGEILFDGVDIARLKRDARSRFRRSGRISYVFQDTLQSLDPGLSVGESAVEPLLVQSRTDKRAAVQKARELFERFGLDQALFDRRPAQLSGGQRQRVGLIRALVLEPRLLVLDEPLSALDAANKASTIELLSDLTTDGIALLLISHDIGSVAAITDRTYVLWRGKIVEEASTKDLVREQRHDYAKLLVGSAGSLFNRGISKAERAELRSRVELAAAE